MGVQIEDIGGRTVFGVDEGFGLGITVGGDVTLAIPGQKVQS